MKLHILLFLLWAIVLVFWLVSQVGQYNKKRERKPEAFSPDRDPLA